MTQEHEKAIAQVDIASEAKTICGLMTNSSDDRLAAADRSVRKLISLLGPVTGKAGE